MIDAWPIRAWIAFGWAPDAMDRATLECLKSWKRHDRPAMDRGGRQAGRQFVVQPVLDLISRKAAEPVGPEPREDVPVEVAPVRLLRLRRQPPAQLEELFSPLRERLVGPRGSIQLPRSFSVSISRTRRSASALRVKVLEWARPSGSR